MEEEEEEEEKDQEEQADEANEAEVAEVAAGGGYANPIHHGVADSGTILFYSS